MNFQDELRRKRKELEKGTPATGTQDPSAAERQNKIAHFKTLAIPLIDGLLNTFFSEGYPRLKWKAVDTIPGPGMYPYRPETINYPEFLRGPEHIHHQPLGPCDLKAFKVSSSKSTFVIRLGYSTANLIQLVELAAVYAGGDKPAAARSVFDRPAGFEEGLAFIDELVRVQVESVNENAQKALEKFLLAAYEREHAEGFFKKKK